MLISEKAGQLEKEAREQGAGSKGDRTERGFALAPCLFIEVRLAYFPQLSRYIPLVKLNAHD